MAVIADMRCEVDVRLRRGEPLELIEDDLITPSDLDEDHKAALWLYGWACLEQEGHRVEPRLDRPGDDPDGAATVSGG